MFALVAAYVCMAMKIAFLFSSFLALAACISAAAMPLTEESSLPATRSEGKRDWPPPPPMAEVLSFLARALKCSVFLSWSRRLVFFHDRKTEHFKALAKNDNTSAITDHVKATGHNIKWDHFDVLAKGKTDYHCKIKETLYIQELEPAFNVNVGSEKLMLY